MNEDVNVIVSKYISGPGVVTKYKSFMPIFSLLDTYSNILCFPIQNYGFHFLIPESHGH